MDQKQYATQEPGPANEGEQWQQRRPEEEVQLPSESSPYVQYKDTEDYKMRAYGTQGHQTPVDLPHGGVGTDAPTLSGSGLSENQVRATDAMNRQGVP